MFITTTTRVKRHVKCCTDGFDGNDLEQYFNQQLTQFKERHKFRVRCAGAVVVVILLFVLVYV